MKPRFIAPLAFGATFGLCHLLSQTQPQAHNPVGALIPRGWVILSEGTARGDLNRDGRPDLALAIGWQNEEERIKADRDAQRRLLIFFRQPDGRLKQVFVNATTIMSRNEGGVLGDPFQSLQIERGSLVVDHWGGSREQWEYTHRFRFQGGRWTLIGLRNAVRDRLTLDTSQRDTNLVTGEVEYSGTTGDKGTARRRFLELRAVPAGRTGPRLKLANAAQLWANLEGSTLVVKAHMRNARASLRLRDARGRVVKPLSRQQRGRVQTVRFSWKALNPYETYSGTWVGTGEDVPSQPDYVADATLEVVLADRVWKTSRGPYPAQIRFTRRTEAVLPPLLPSKASV